jgi:endonuclease/exonuclease/phosphatase family metal-dependent hydrolase
MRSGAFFFSLLFWLALGPAHGSSGSFCVQTFNVYGPAYASSVDWRISRLADELLRDPCDSIQLQELWRQTHYDSLQRQLYPARLAMLRADEVRSDRAITGLASAFSGQVLAARSELFQVNNKSGPLDWIRDLTGVQKGFTLLHVKLDRGPQAVYINLHTHPTDQTIRVAQMIQLIKAAVDFPGASELPLLLAGDLNATPNSLELALLQNVLLLRDSFPEANGSYGATCTYCGSNPLSWSRKNRVIDFILARNAPTLSLETQSSEINLRGSPREPLSDHFGVRTLFGWAEREERQLDPREPLAQERVERAIASLSQAADLLNRRRGSGFREAARQAKELRAGLQSGSQRLLRALLTP